MSKLHEIPRPGVGGPHADVIFVHGLGGGPFTTWQHDRKKQEDSWPYWLAAELPEVTVHTLDYEVSASNWFGRAMPLTHRATNVLDLLATKHVGCRPIVFVCHSLGGLLVKKLLQRAMAQQDANWPPIAAQTRAVVFLATPHLGADLALWASRLGLLLRSSPAIRGLVAHAPDLTELHEWYQNNARRLGIKTISYYETYKTNYLMLLPFIRNLPFIGPLPTTVQVVATGDANPGIEGVTPVPLDADHITICKPGSKVEPLCRRVIDVVREVIGDASRLGDAPIDPLFMKDDLPDFQDRGEKQSCAITALRTGKPVAIGGMGGAGKTELALYIAHALTDQFPDGQRYLDLQGMSDKPLSTLEAMSKVVQSFDQEAKAPPDLDHAVRDYRQALDNKKVLLLLDDAEDGEQVAPLLKHRAPKTLVLVTSRQIISADGLVPVQLGQMTAKQARDFLRELLPGHAASHAELDTLAKHCGYLPLALRVAGRFLQHHPGRSIGEYVEALDKAEEELALKGEMDKDVRLVLGYSARQLSQKDQSLAEHWQMLAVFDADFDRAAATAVWDLEEHAARNALEELVSRSMLLFDAATRRYRLHDLMRDVARLPLEGEDQATVERRLEVAAARHAQHYCKVLAQANQLYLKGGENVLTGLALYDVEQRNIAAGQAWTAQRIETADDAARLAAKYANASAEVLVLRLPPRARIGWFEAQLKACRKLRDRRGEGTALGNLGNSYRELGEPRQSIKYSKQSLAIKREINDRRGEANSLGNLGLAYAALGAPRQAIKRYKETLAIARETDDRRSEGHARRYLGKAYAALGAPRQAIEHYEEALAIARETDDRRSEGYALGNLGLAYADLGEPGCAIDHHKQHLKIARETDDRRSAGYALFNGAVALDQLGERGEAIRRLEDALRTYEEIDHPNADRARAKLAEWRGEAGG
jgi:tetratricopeptide (TPR) repeat protein